MLDTDGPSLRDLRDYRYPINGQRERHSGFWGVTPTTAGHFVAVGDVRHPQSASVPVALRGKTAVAILGIATDRIMGNGFE
ncbi:MAG: hypothetical protein J0L88_12030 [Xanthomonadales bacterium]|nr:hypothetical protein [Xanthomonadales bacterium]